MSSLIPIGQEFTDLSRLSKILVDSSFLPQAVNTPQKAFAIMLMGRELGIGPMEAFSKISVIQGKPSMGAELQKAQVHKKLPGAIFNIKKSTDKECIISAARPGNPITDFGYTWDDAVKMGLTGKDNWKKQPKTMLMWRAVSAVCRAVFPDCLSGISHTPEELGAVVDEEGKVIDLPPEENLNVKRDGDFTKAIEEKKPETKPQEEGLKKLAQVKKEFEAANAVPVNGLTQKDIDEAFAP